MKKCLVQNCKNIHHAKDFCEFHYTKNYYKKHKKLVDKRNKIYYYKNKKQIMNQIKEYTHTPDGRYVTAKQGAKKRHLSWTISKLNFINIINTPCHYCKWKLHKNITGSGMDRINNNKGYELTNVLPCCGFCNRLKGTLLTITETELLVKYLIKIRGKRK